MTPIRIRCVYQKNKNKNIYISLPKSVTDIYTKHTHTRTPHNFAFSLSLSFSPTSSNHLLTAPLATSTAPASSTVAGTSTPRSNSPRAPFSSSCRSTRRSVFPLRVLGIMPPWPTMAPPREAMAPICVRMRVCRSV